MHRPEMESACAEYGQALGTAFQVIDDVLDYAGEAQTMGKNLGDDLREGITWNAVGWRRRMRANW